MYTIYAHTFNGITETHSFIDVEYARDYFNRVIFAEDCKSVDFCNGMTGEVLAIATKEKDSINIEYLDDELFNIEIKDIESDDIEEEEEEKDKIELHEITIDDLCALANYFDNMLRG